MGEEERKRKHREHQRKWAKNNPEKIKDSNLRRREYKRKWKEDNKERLREYNHMYYEKNKEKIKEYTKEWIAENPEKVREYNQKWRAEHPDYIGKWRKSHLEEYRKYHREYMDVYKRDPDEKYKLSIRAQTNWKYGEGWVCQRCGSDMNIEHHHTTEPYQVDEFMDLCRSCHRKVHVIGG